MTDRGAYTLYSHEKVPVRTQLLSDSGDELLLSLDELGILAVCRNLHVVCGLVDSRAGWDQIVIHYLADIEIGLFEEGHVGLYGLLSIFAILREVVEEKGRGSGELLAMNRPFHKILASHVNT